MTAYFVIPPDQRPRIRIYDTGAMSASEALNRAVQEGRQFVVANRSLEMQARFRRERFEIGSRPAGENQFDRARRPHVPPGLNQHGEVFPRL